MKLLIPFFALVICATLQAATQVILGPGMVPSSVCTCFGPSSSLGTNLVAYWPLNEASGDAIDIGPNTQTLTDVNTVGSVSTGICGNVRDFELGNSEYFTRADSATMSTGNIDFSFSFWAKLESITANQEILSKGDGSTHFEYLIRVFNSGANNFFRFDVEDGASHYGGVNDTNNLVTGVWYFGVVWHDATANTVNIRINGGGVQSSGHTFGSYDSAHAFRIGAGTIAPEDYWDGLIGDVGFWKRVLTTDEQATLYNNGKIGRYCP